jgi:hypothetical protein
MEENLNIMIKEAFQEQDDENQDTAEIEEEETFSFEIVGGKLFEVIGNKLSLIANFYLKIISRSLLIDEGITIDQLLDLKINFQDKVGVIRLTAKEFNSGNFMSKVWAEVGTGAILYGSKKKLVVATQEISGDNIPIRQVMTSHGFTADNCYLSPSIKIEPKGIAPLEDIELDLSGGNFSKRIGFLHADDNDVKDVATHIYQDFLNLKTPAVMYPLLGHVCLAPFSSILTGEMGLKKPALHLEGPSGGGKTMLAALAMSFFGNFQDHFVSWTSTANAIEREGYFFRDSLFLIDDLKSSVVAPETVIRTLQNYVDGHGRARMRSNASLQKQFYIRGLLLSTGEDFVDNMESINGRTIVINVEPDKNTVAGNRCLKNRELYRCFMPELIQTVICDPDWKNKFQDSVNKKVAEFHTLTKDLPNGLRISLNWALNFSGFSFFVNVIKKFGIIDKKKAEAMLAEYMEIAAWHIQSQSIELVQNDPVVMMFRIMQQKIQAGQVSIINLTGTPGKGKVVGTVQGKGVVYLYPDLVMEMLSSHFHKMPFSKKALTQALARKGFITRSENGRWTKQVRDKAGKQTRLNVWEIKTKLFKENCGISGS